MTDLRQELLGLASAITNGDLHISDSEYDAMVERWAALCPHPAETDILFWPNELGLCRREEVNTFEMSPEEMVEYALNWEPRTVAMRVMERAGGKPSATIATG